jgi:hypothetical protein
MPKWDITKSFTKGRPTMKEGSILTGLVWMFVLSVLLFWLPLLGPLIAGFVGGKKSGSLGNALWAAFLPGILFAVLMFVFASSLTGMPLLGAVAGSGAFFLSMAGIGPLLLGAVIGGLVATPAQPAAR